MCFAQGGQQGGAAGGPSSSSYGAGENSMYPVGSSAPAGVAAAQSGATVPLPKSRPSTLLSGMDIEADKPNPNRPTASEAQRSGEGDDRTLDAGTTSQNLAYRKKRDQTLMEA